MKKRREWAGGQGMGESVARGRSGEQSSVHTHAMPLTPILIIYNAHKKKTYF